MTPKENLMGRAFGRLTVVAEAPSTIDDGPRGRLRTQWLCRCTCGKEKRVRADVLKRGHALSCGCLQVEHGARLQRRTLEQQRDRLMEQITIDERGCWNMPEKPWRKKYALIHADGKLWGAHRLMWVVTNGAIPDGQFVLHDCDNPRCINPAHLHLGDHRQNMRECVLRGRHPRAKLTVDEVHKLRWVRGAVTVRRAAKDFGISENQVRTIWAGHQWGYAK